jgi:hypothetical protein
MRPRLFNLIALSVSVTFTDMGTAAVTGKAAEAEQLRIIKVMTDQLRGRIDRLPVLIPPDHPVGAIKEQVVTLNRDSVVLEGQRFDGIVVTAPEAKAAFAWAFAAPVNCASWYILREKGDMKGFANFLRQTRSQVPLAASMKPEAVENVTFQTLSSQSWSPKERYVIWFRFTDDRPAEVSLRAGFFARSSLSNHALPSLLFPESGK